MSILKYKDPKTGEFKRINPYKADLSFIGKDGIVVNKAANSEMVEISGSGCVQKVTDTAENRRVVTIEPNSNTYTTRPISTGALVRAVAQRQDNGELLALVSNSPTDYTLTNKKYVNDNYVGKLKFTNLEQALNGYILDTTKEAYADLDSAVLKYSVAVGDNVYPIADKTRALVTRIEGKTTKMVQLLKNGDFSQGTDNWSKYSAAVNNISFEVVDNSLEVTALTGGTGGDIYMVTQQGMQTSVVGHKYLILVTAKIMQGEGITGFNYEGYAALTPLVKIDNTNLYYAFITAATAYDWYGLKPSGTKAVGDKWSFSNCQCFNLTAMNREDITTAEQFKAEFPNLYPYENGNIYPAKISGVKFTGKNLFDYNWTRIVEGDVRNASIVKALENGAILQGNESDTPGNQYYPNGWFSPGYESDKYKIYLRAGDRVTIFANYEILESDNTLATVGLHLYGIMDNYLTSLHSVKTKVLTRIVQTFTIKSNDSFYLIFTLNSNKVKITDIQIEISDAATAYEPYIEPVSVTLPKLYDLHGIGDYKDYLEITKNEDNELYTLKKVQSVEVNESEKTITPLATPVETVIATNLTYEQVTAIRHNGGLIEVVGNTNKAYAKPTIKNTVVYRLTATNKAEV